MSRCRKVTLAEALRAASRNAGRALTASEKRAVSAEHGAHTRLVCGQREPGADTDWDETRADASRGFFAPRRRKRRGLLGLGFLGL